MTALIFFIFAAIAVFCGINLVAQTHPIASALSLIGVMGSLAVLYLAAGRRIHRRGAGDRLRRRDHGAVCLRHHAAECRRRRHVAASVALRQVSSASFLLAAFLGLISFIIQAMLPKTEGVVFGAFQGGTALDIGRKLFTIYLLPFEVTSVLILIAIVGAIVLAQEGNLMPCTTPYP